MRFEFKEGSELLNGRVSHNIDDHSLMYSTEKIEINHGRVIELVYLYFSVSLSLDDYRMVGFGACAPRSSWHSMALSVPQVDGIGNIFAHAIEVERLVDRQIDMGFDEQLAFDYSSNILRVILSDCQSSTHYRIGKHVIAGLSGGVLCELCISELEASK